MADLTDRDDLAYWFPILSRIPGVIVPKTEIVTTTLPLVELCDGKPPDGFDEFCTDLLAAAYRVRGFPIFLRSGQTSDKHGWARTCFVSRPEDIPSHVAAIVEFSEMADFLGLSTRTWAVREFLNLEAYFTAFEGMPVAREYRCFFEGGNQTPLCLHPYWPPDSIRNPSRPDYMNYLVGLNTINESVERVLTSTVGKVAPHFDGRWSLDVARCVDGSWVVTDMAEMDRSFHWAGCPNSPPGCSPSASACDRDGDEFDLMSFFKDSPS